MRQATRTLLIFVSLFLGSVLLPADEAAAQSVSERLELICSQQLERTNTVTETFNTRLQTYETALNSQSDNRSHRRAAWDEKLATSRARADLSRSESYQLLIKRQPSEELTERARQYTAAVDDAIAARRQAYDDTRTSFRASVDSLLAEREQSIKSASASFKDAAASAMDQARAGCSTAHGDRAQIRDSLITSLREARLSYGETLRNRPDFRRAVQTEIETRNQALRIATTAFEQTMQTLRADYADLVD